MSFRNFSLMLGAAMLTACSLDPGRPRGMREILTVDGRVRSYLVYVPQAREDKPALLLVFHGLGGGGTQMERLTDFNLVADALGFIVVYPDAEITTMGQWALDCPRCTVADTLGIDDLAFVDSIVERVDAAYDVDRKRVYATGFSLGGYMTHVLACKRGATFAAVAPVAGHMTDLKANACPAPARAVPFLEVSGMADLVMPWSGVEHATHTIFSADSSAGFWAARNGCTGAANDSLGAGSTRVRTYTACEAEVQRWGVPGLAHDWPASAPFDSFGIMTFLLRFSS